MACLVSNWCLVADQGRDSTGGSVVKPRGQRCPAMVCNGGRDRWSHYRSDRNAPTFFLVSERERNSHHVGNWFPDLWVDRAVSILYHTKRGVFLERGSAEQSY